MSNVGNLDRVIRALVGLALIVVPLVSGWPLWSSVALFAVAEVVGAVLVATAAIGFCPLYAALGLSSKHKPVARS